VSRAHRIAGVALATAALTVASPARAQVRMSERGTVSQVLDGATITIDYSRPEARGRDSLFGKVVPWGHVWTPGANWATTIEADRDFRLNGRAVPKGKYAIWLVTRASGDWTLLLTLPAKHFHVPPPDTATATLAVAVTPEQRPTAEEVLTWSFPSVGPDAATLRMQWGTTAVPIRLSVEPTRLAVVPAGERATYVGDYAFKRPNGTNNVAHVADEAGTLRVHQDGKIYGVYDYFDFVPDGPGRFKRALYLDGKMVEVESELTYVFDVSGGRVTGFSLLGPNNQVLLHADRVK
jgi:hypothetical protein